MTRLRDRRRIRATAADGAISILPISKDITLQWGPFAARNSVHGRAVHGNDSHLHSKSEPVDGKGNGGYPHNWSPKMEATAATLGMNNESRNVSLELVLAEADSGNTVRLRGPSIRIPDRFWNELPVGAEDSRIVCLTQPVRAEWTLADARPSCEAPGVHPGAEVRQAGLCGEVAGEHRISA